MLPVTGQIAENMHSLEKIPREKLTVLPSGTNIELFVPMEKSSCCERLGFNQEFLYIGFIGTFYRHQGIDILIEAAPFIITNYPHVRFLLIGDGPMRPAWEKKVRQYGLATHFIFSGSVPYQDVPIYLGIMDICVAPFLKEAAERSPVKIFDYLASGKPVVAANVGETSGFFSPSEAVILVCPEDALSLAQGIMQLAENEKLRVEMGKKGRDFIIKSYGRMRSAEIVEKITTDLIFPSAEKGLHSESNCVVRKEPD
jgi:glycosyltransferase involved in cell wall biosynthesis